MAASPNCLDLPDVPSDDIDSHEDSEVAGTGAESTSLNLQKGIDLITKATESDKCKDYPGALQLYKEGIQCLIEAVKSETKSVKAKETIQRKCRQYLDRATKLKEYLEKKRATREKGDVQKVDNLGFKQELESIIWDTPAVKWDDIIGLQDAKDALKEKLILPLKFPLLFKGARRFHSNCLLFGAPGTGKTYLAKSVVTEAESVKHIMLSAHSIVGKLKEDMNKNKGVIFTKELFKYARENKPTFIFIDDIEAFCQLPEITKFQHRQFQDIRIEFLVQMTGDNEDVHVFAATNEPWLLDSAIRRRFDKRVYTPLPNQQDRSKMVKSFLVNSETEHSLSEADFDAIGSKTDGYTGSDILHLVQLAKMQPVCDIQKSSYFRKFEKATTLKSIKLKTTKILINEKKYFDFSHRDMIGLAMTSEGFFQIISEDRKIHKIVGNGRYLCPENSEQEDSTTIVDDRTTIDFSENVDDANLQDSSDETEHQNVFDDWVVIDSTDICEIESDVHSIVSQSIDNVDEHNISLQADKTEYEVTDNFNRESTDNSESNSNMKSSTPEGCHDQTSRTTLNDISNTSTDYLHGDKQCIPCTKETTDQTSLNTLDEISYAPDDSYVHGNEQYMQHIKEKTDYTSSPSTLDVTSSTPEGSLHGDKHYIPCTKDSTHETSCSKQDDNVEYSASTTQENTDHIDERYIPCSPDTVGAVKMSSTEIPIDKLILLPVSMDHFINSLSNFKPTVGKEDLEKQLEFKRDFVDY